MGLYPMVETSSPNMPPISPLKMEPEASPAITVIPNIAIQNISEGPNFKAI